jgi:hypothetical protein
MVRRPKRCQYEAEKNQKVRPPFAAMHKFIVARFPGQEHQSPQPYGEKPGMGGDVAEVWNTKKTASVGELMVRRWQIRLQSEVRRGSDADRKQ